MKPESYLLEEARRFSTFDAWLGYIGYELTKKFNDAKLSGFKGLLDVYRTAWTFKKAGKNGKQHTTGS